MKYLCIDDEGYGKLFTKGLTYTIISKGIDEEEGLVEVISNNGRGVWLEESDVKQDFIPYEIRVVDNYVQTSHHLQA